MNCPHCGNAVFKPDEMEYLYKYLHGVPSESLVWSQKQFEWLKKFAEQMKVLLK